MTNNTDGAALLPVTQEATIEFLNHAFRNIELPELFNADLADIAGGLERFARQFQSHSLPATQEDAERSGVGDDDASQADRDHAMKWINHNMMLATGLMKSSSEAGNGAENFRAHDAYRALKVAKAALSTPQRQEYDGEAVREAFEAGWQAARDYFQVARGIPGSDALKRQADEYAAALAHPAQATPSAVSGDAGEGE